MKEGGPGLVVNSTSSYSCCLCHYFVFTSFTVIFFSRIERAHSLFTVDEEQSKFKSFLPHQFLYERYIMFM